ncbi:hypothetical protein M409DRAFT_60409 [Zasmidium cellare ATCC 36951]|uniref:Uncharacterized protein n=1 Tax=Zasmidium cellare ATCC 36951 TaxID=1080233 RepID=A0A6A6C2Q0_ZASCE|nr:uncharacterized protein M409DRAFT_60409 [Zasmidium cellare ATCC 36951]KAF2160009.1 hypothetical protein M409DRAFT_60409 [Zasmidium cellare ATCC 36951]
MLLAHREERLVLLQQSRWAALLLIHIIRLLMGNPRVLIPSIAKHAGDPKLTLLALTALRPDQLWHGLVPGLTSVTLLLVRRGPAGTGRGHTVAVGDDRGRCEGTYLQSAGVFLDAVLVVAFASRIGRECAFWPVAWHRFGKEGVARDGASATCASECSGLHQADLLQHFINTFTGRSSVVSTSYTSSASPHPFDQRSREYHKRRTPTIMSAVAAILITPKADVLQPRHRELGLQGFVRLDISCDKFNTDTEWLTSPVSEQIARTFFLHYDVESTEFRQVVEGAVVRGDFVVARVDRRPISPMQLFQIVHFIAMAVHAHEVNRTAKAKHRRYLMPLVEQFTRANMMGEFDLLLSKALKNGDSELAIMSNPFDDTFNENEQIKEWSDGEGTVTASPEKSVVCGPATVFCRSCGISIIGMPGALFRYKKCRFRYEAQWLTKDEYATFVHTKKLMGGQCIL